MVLRVDKENQNKRGPLSAVVRKPENVQFMQEIEALLGLDSEFPEDYVCDLLQFIWIYFAYASRHGVATDLDKIWFDKISDVQRRLIKKLNKKRIILENKVTFIDPNASIQKINSTRYPIPAFFMQEAPCFDLILKSESFFDKTPVFDAIKYIFFKALIIHKGRSGLEDVASRLRLSLANPCPLHIEIIQQVSEEYGFRNFRKLSGFLDDLSVDHCYRESAIFEDVVMLAKFVRYDHYVSSTEGSLEARKPFDLSGSLTQIDASLTPPAEGKEYDKPIQNRSWEARYQRITSNRYTRLTPVERHRVVHVLAELLESQENSEVDGAATVVLMYLTGMLLGDLLAARVGDHGDFSADGTYRRFLQRPMNAYEPPAEFISLFEEYQDRIELQLPNIILPWMRERLGHRHETLLECMGGDEARVRKSVELIMERIRDSDRFQRIRVERISAALAIELAIKYQDPTVIFYLSGRPNYIAPVLSYYVVHSVDELASRYSKTIQELLELPSHCSEISRATAKLSGYFPTTETISRLRDGLSEQFRLVLARKDDIITRHNAFTSYCLGLLLLVTGHRPVQDPFPSISHFDLARGLLLICDKVSDQSRAWRVVALPEMAVSQMRVYLDYLPKLAAHLRQQYPGSSLPQRIVRMAQGEAGMLPLFFLLNAKDLNKHVSITESELSTQWSAYWQIPVNFLRHIMATRLLSATNRADYVQLQLGHMTGPDHPLGLTATESVFKTLGMIGFRLDIILRELGWGVLEHRMRMPSSGAVRSRSDNLQPNRFGPAVRRAVWELKQARAGDLIKELIAEQPQRAGKILQAELETLLRRVETEAEKQDYGVDRCRRLLDRYVRRQRGGKELLRQVGYARQVEVEPSPFTEETLENYRALTVLRGTFLGYLDQQGRQGSLPTEEERLVEILCSAALFGGIANLDRLKFLGPALGMSTYRFGGRLFVDIPLSDDKKTAVAVSRWFPDPLSSSLIEGYFKVRRLKHAPILASERAMQKLLSLIGGPGEKPLERLAEMSKAGLILEAPGYVAAAASGDITGVSLPLSAWVRVESGQALQSKIEPDGIHQDHGWSPDLRESATSWSIDECGSFLRLLKRIIARGKNGPRTASKGVSLQQKKRLIELLENAVDASPTWPVLPKLLAGWAVHLCRNGTSYKSSLAYSTIEKYLLLVANRLCPATAKLVGSFDFDEDDFEQLYLSVVASEPKKIRPELARLLYAFHSYIVDSYLVEDLDWSEIMATAGGSGPISYADANYITSSEYHRASQAVLQDASLSDYQRWQRAGLLMWGYRFGLRFGEAFRLQYRDIQRDGDELCLWVRNTLHGEVKTNASRRVVYLLEELSDDEKVVLDGLISAGKSDFQEDGLIPLLRSSAGSRALQNRYQVAQYLGRLLKNVTGDESIRFHHMRHGFVTRQVGAFAGVDIPGFCNETLRPWVRREDAENLMGYPLRSISVAIGHASEMTTLGSYTHCLDLITSKYYSDASSTSTSDFAVAYAEQLSPSTPRQRRTRGKSSGQCAPIPSPNVKTRMHTPVSHKPEVWQPKPLRLPEYDRLLQRFSEAGRQIEAVAASLEIDAETVHAVVARATKVETLSGYRGYRLAERSDDPLARAAIYKVETEKLYNKETARLRVLLEQLEPKLGRMPLDEQGAFFSGVEVWLQSTSRAREVCMVANSEELRALVSMAGTLGASAMILVKTGYDMELLEGLKEPGIVIQQMPKRKAGSIAGSVGVKLQSPGEIGTHRSLRRLLFLLATFGGVSESPLVP